ncbi:methyltransferase [Iocasia frigidifontis]|uniref:Methyltransferase n=1 Tax=Iocasia fonsfrigidae TaxID=2682810 RepID=A0A8A7KLY1_9FIRM|nr:acetylserotonin O-methyltransferase [Iocasia fonsfrigidae]QTL98842.1 methyltransferase [Iocasia fonsfrigidae]
MYQPKENSKLYHRLLHQKRETELFLSAVRLNIFSYLEEWTTAKIVAERTGFNERNLDLFFNALACIGLLEKGEGIYRNTSQSNEFLNQRSPIYLGEWILFREEMMSLKQLDERIKNGPVDEIVRNNKGVEVYDFYEAARVSISEMYSGRVQSFVKVALSLFKNDFPKKILDLGGGSGVLVMELVSLFPDCSGVIFEYPGVAVLARKLVAERGLTQQVSVLEGDFTVDSIGGDYDLIIASGILDFARDHLNTLMDKMYHALTASGYLYVVTHNISEDYQRPPESILGWLSSHLEGLDILLSKKTVDSALKQHGFRRVHINDVNGIFKGLQGEFYSK